MSEAFYILISLAALAVACIGGIWFGIRLARQRRQRAQPRSSYIYLFDKGILDQANAEGLRYLDQVGLPYTASWEDLRGEISKVIADLPMALYDEKNTVRVIPQNPISGAAHAVFEHFGSLTRVTVCLKTAEVLTQLDTSARSWETAIMEAPFPIWQQAKSGERIWQNQMFLDLKMDRSKLQMEVDEGSNIAPFRLTHTPDQTGSPMHFDVQQMQIGDDRFFYALNVDRTVEAETVRREFVQTLGKTFAQLSTGIAVFDKNVKLMLFNPALIDLFGFEAQFLATKPTLHGFFDHMREHRMIPEPRNYTSWREQLTTLILGASEGKYKEVWQLPSGETIRVTGQPHPDGALGFLFEDISSEVTLSRRFKEDLTQAYALLDALSDPVVAINRHGVLFFANHAFKEVWKVDPEASFADFTTSDLLSVLSETLPQSSISKLETALNIDAPEGAMTVSTPLGDLQITDAPGQITVLTHHTRPPQLTAAPQKNQLA